MISAGSPGPEDAPRFDLLIELAPPGSGALMTSHLQCPRFSSGSSSILSLTSFLFSSPLNATPRDVLYDVYFGGGSVLSFSPTLLFLRRASSLIPITVYWPSVPPLRLFLFVPVSASSFHDPRDLLLTL